MKKYVILILAVLMTSFSFGQKTKKTTSRISVPTEQTICIPTGDTLEFKIESGYFWIKDKGKYKKLESWTDFPDMPKPLAVALPHGERFDCGWKYVILVYYRQGEIREAFMDIASKDVWSVQAP